MIDSLTILEQRFKARYDSYRILRGKGATTRAWKRAWLDVKREIRKAEKGAMSRRLFDTNMSSPEKDKEAGKFKALYDSYRQMGGQEATATAWEWGKRASRHECSHPGCKHHVTHPCEVCGGDGWRG